MYSFDLSAFSCIYLIRMLLFFHLYLYRHLRLWNFLTFSVIHWFLHMLSSLETIWFLFIFLFNRKLLTRVFFCFTFLGKTGFWGFYFCFQFLAVLHCDPGVILIFLLCAAVWGFLCALALDGFLCVCRARCRRKCVLLSESEAHYTSTTSVDYVPGFCHTLTRKKQVKSWESLMLLPQTASQLWIELRGVTSVVWLGGAFSKTPPLASLCRVTRPVYWAWSLGS